MKYVIRKLSKTGNGRSYSTTLPREAVKSFKWKERQKLIIRIDPKKKRFIVEDWPGSLKRKRAGSKK